MDDELRKAAQAMVDAWTWREGDLINQCERIEKAREALRAALAAPEPQPMYFGLTHDGTWLSVTPSYYKKLKPDMRMKVYTAPVAPQREWVGLTEEDIFDEWGNCQPIDHGFPERYAKALDAALKEKNNAA